MLFAKTLLIVAIVIAIVLALALRVRAWRRRAAGERARRLAELERDLRAR